MELRYLEYSVAAGEIEHAAAGDAGAGRSIKRTLRPCTGPVRMGLAMSPIEYYYLRKPDIFALG